MKSSIFLLGILAQIYPGPGAAANPNSRLLRRSYGFPGTNRTFDYVVIGGGTSGLTVAKRLAENAALSVVVIEAGGYYEIESGNFSEIPAYESLYESAPASIDWQIYTTPQPQLGMRSIHYSQGRCIGGSSGRNGMAYQRGTIGSYQAWADAVGDDSYTFDSLLPYFQKSITFTPPDYSKRGGPEALYEASAFSSSGGPLHVSWWNYFIPVSNFYRQALVSLGFKETGSIQSGSLLGFAQYPATLKPEAQIRDSSETSFGQAVFLNTNFFLYNNTLVKQILFQDKKATGVRVSSAGGSIYSISARKEVILAAGPFRSPQLLMVSGVGPKDTLKSLDIDVIADLPGVGQNLQDQPGFGVGGSVDAITQHRLFSNTTYAAEASASFLRDQSGPLTAFASNYIAWEHLPNSTNITADARADLAAYPSDWPDLQYILNGVGLTTNVTGDYAAVGVVLMKTTSRGNVTINSTDTEDSPVVSVNWLSTATDQQLAIASVRRARAIQNATGVAVTELLPGEAVQTDAEVLQFIRQSAGPSHHAVATCKMGKSTDLDAVVDSQGRVLGGISGLRIVDASAWPLLPPGQPMATVYAIAEKLADVILRGEIST